MRIILCCLVLLLCPNASSEEYFGKYNGDVETKWHKDGRNMEILTNFSFEDPNGLIWLAQAGNVVDGASIPQWLWRIIGSPFTGKYRDASVIHDIACENKERTWELVHLAFYYAMRASGVNTTKAKTMYAAVYHYGPRWVLESKVKVEGHQSIKIIPAQYEAIEERVLVSEATEKLVVVPPAYESHPEKILVEDARTTWKTFECPDEGCDIGDIPNRVPGSLERIDHSTGEIMWLVEIPASYKTITRRVLKTPATTKSISIPEVYKVQKVRKLLKPAQQKVVDISTSYQTIGIGVKFTPKLSESDFEKLVSLISDSESKETEVSLYDIRRFR